MNTFLNYDRPKLLLIIADTVYSEMQSTREWVGSLVEVYKRIWWAFKGSSHGDRALQRGKRFFIIKDRSIYLFNMLYGLLNSNSTNVDLNQVVFAFNTLFNSAGILSMVNSLTITARILQIYDFPPRAVSRIETRIRNKKDR